MGEWLEFWLDRFVRPFRKPSTGASFDRTIRNLRAAGHGLAIEMDRYMGVLALFEFRQNAPRFFFCSRITSNALVSAVL
jgi:hypothetical protein